MLFAIKNVKERLKGEKKQNIPATPDKYHQMILSDITEMHYARNQEEYSFVFDKVFTKWYQIEEIRNFQDYFYEQWINSKFNRWQIFHTAPGYASTNNPLEAGLNKEIKGTYTNYEQVSMIGMVKLMNKIIVDYSLAQKLPFEVKLTRDNAIAKEAQHYTKNGFCYIDIIFVI